MSDVIAEELRSLAVLDYQAKKQLDGGDLHGALGAATMRTHKQYRLYLFVLGGFLCLALTSLIVEYFRGQHEIRTFPQSLAVTWMAILQIPMLLWTHGKSKQVAMLSKVWKGINTNSRNRCDADDHVAHSADRVREGSLI